MSNASKRILSLLVVAVMVFSMIPATVFATDAQTETQQTVTTPAQQDAPDATVSVLKPLKLTQAEHNYMCWPSGDKTIDRPLQIVMNFKANETLEECVAGKFSKYLVDFYLQVDGLANGTIMTDGCYLAGNYGSFGWIVIPADGIEMEEGISYPIVSAYDATLNYKDICGSVKDFTAAIYISDKILNENPNFKVTLELRMTNPDDRSDVIVVGTPATYTVADLQAGMEYLNKYDDVATEHVEKIEQVNTNTTIDTQEHAEVIEATKTYMLERFPDLTEEQVAAAVTEVVIAFQNMEYEEDKAPKKITYSVSPVVKAGTYEQKITTFDEPVTFRLPVSNAETNTKANVYHEDELMGVYPIDEVNGVKFVEVSSKNFSNFTVEPTDGYVAAIGEDKFETLQAAFEAAKDGDVITVLGNVLLTGVNNNGYTEGIFYNGDQSFTVDLGGYTVLGSDAINDYVIYLRNLGAKANTITFKNGKIIAGGSGAYSTLCAGSNSSLYPITINLDNMYLENNTAVYGDDVVRVRNGSIANVNAGTTVVSNGASAAVCATAGSTVNVNSGATVIQKNSGVTSGNNVYTAITGLGTVNVYDSAVVESDNYGVYMSTSGNAQVNVYGGTITAPKALWAVTNGGVGESVTINVTGGTINGALGEANADSAVVVKGGTFSTDVSDYVADGYEYDAETGKVVIDPSAFVASVNGIGYDTLQDAVTALRANGGTLTLLADANESITLNYPADGAPVELTIDLNGFTITSAESTLWVSDGYKVTIKDSKGTGKIISTNAGGEAIAITRNGHVILESGYVYNDFCAVWMYKATENGTFVMNGGTLEVPNGGQTLSVGAGKATINGGKILCNKIPGGGGWNTLVYENGALEITGGEFLGTIGTHGGPISISGGTFSYCDDPNDGFRNEHLVDGYATKVNADGSLTVYALPTSLSGSGTQEDPYLINNLDDLKFFRNNVNNGNRYNGQFVKLNADIDLNDEEWTPIGDRNVDQGSFLGTFDGGNHTISNLWISKWNKTGAGFFSKIGLQTEHVTGTVKNVTFNNVTIISSQSYVGVIAQAPSGALIENVHITGEVNISGYGYVGGIVGHGYPTINDCSVKAYGEITANYWGAGAILGFSGDHGARINNATVAGVDDPSTEEKETFTVHGSQGGAATVAGGAYGAAVKDATVSNADVTSNSDYCMGYVTAGGTLQGEIVVENVTSTANGVAVAPDEVAKVGEVIYTDLVDAINAAKNGGTVVLLADVQLEGDDYIEITEGMDVTITGNYTITGNDGFWVLGGKLTLGEGLTVVANVYNAVYIRGGEVITSANLIAKDIYSAIQGNGNYAGNVTIKGGNITAEKSTAIYWPQNGVLTIEGGNITGLTGIEVRAGSLKMTGGKVTATAALKTAANGNGTTVDGAAVALSQHDTNLATVIEITGGELIATDAAGVAFYQGNHKTKDVASTNIQATIGATVVLDGEVKIAEEGFEMPKAEDGSYTLTGVNYVAQNTTTGIKYETLQDAIDAAGNGDTIVLLADLEQNPVVLPAGVKLDLNGTTIKGNLVGTIVMNGGTWITPEDYKMAGPDADYYKTSDAVIVTDANGNITIAAGTMELAHENWWTGEGQILTIGAEAKFIIPAGKNLNVRSTVVIEGTLVVEGTVNLYETYSTIKSANVIENVITTVNNAKVTYRSGTYSVVKFDEVNSLSTSLKGNIGFKMYFALSEKALADTDAYVVFKIDGQEIARQYIRDAGSPDSDGDYVFECAVAAAQMTKKVSVQIVYSDGTVGAEKAYSVRDYAIKRINNENASAEVKALLRAMLNYGAYAQLHFGYNTGDLANTDVNDLPSIDGVTAESITQSNVQNGTATGIAINGYSTLLESETTFKFSFTLESGYSIADYTFSYVDADGKTITMTPKQDADGSYCVYIEDIPAALLDQMYTITVKNNNDASSYSLTTCVLCYAKSVMNNSNNTEAKVNMAKALYLYSQAANTYFGQ